MWCLFICYEVMCGAFFIGYEGMCGAFSSVMTGYDLPEQVVYMSMSLASMPHCRI